MILQFKKAMIHWFIINHRKRFYDTSLRSIFNASYLSGPIASYFTNRYGCRLVTIAGTVLAAAGMALSTVASSIFVLYLTVGVLTGLGFGLIYLPAIVSVSIYFEKKRAFATGIAVCGSGLGTFLLSPFTKWWGFLSSWRLKSIYNFTKVADAAWLEGLFSGFVRLYPGYHHLWMPYEASEQLSERWRGGRWLYIIILIMD